MGTICERLFEYIDEHELRISDIAAKLNIDPSNFSNWRRRNGDPPAKLIYGIAEALGVNVIWLLTGEGFPTAMPSVLPSDTERAMRYYERLNDEDKDFIKGKMVELHQTEQESEPEKAAVGR